MPYPTETAPDGTILRLIPYPPDQLPSVAKRDIEQAWELAQQVRQNAPTQLFRFTRQNQPPLDLRLEDPDAAAWAAAIDTTNDLTTPHGLSLCLRLLALVALMVNAKWARDWFALSRTGATLTPALLQAAALTPLSPTGHFDETALRALLPPASA